MTRTVSSAAAGAPGEAAGATRALSRAAVATELLSPLAPQLENCRAEWAASRRGAICPAAEGATDFFMKISWSDCDGIIKQIPRWYGGPWTQVTRSRDGVEPAG